MPGPVGKSPSPKPTTPVSTPKPTTTPKVSTPQAKTPTTTGHSTRNTYQGPSAGQLGSAATVAGAPASTLGKLADESAKLTRSWADASRSNMAQVFTEGGEQALQSTGVARATANLETAAQRTAATAGRINTAGKVLGVAGGALTAVDQGLNSSAQSTAGKVTSGTLAGTASYAVGATHPYLAAADAVAGLAGSPETPSNVLNKSIDTLVTVGEAAVTRDTRGLDQLHQRNLSGQNGPVFQTAAGVGEQYAGIIDAVTTGDTRTLDNLHQRNLSGQNGGLMKVAAEAGDYWAENGVVGGLQKFWNAIW